MQKIIFLDIDGPLIPSRMYKPLGTSGFLAPPRLDSGFFAYDKEAVTRINGLCGIFNAKIVFNSAHNSSGERTLCEAALANGFDEKYLHNKLITEYPDYADTRIQAIERWVEKNGNDFEWVVIDDWDLDHPNHISVTFQNGFLLEHYLEICKRWTNA